MSIFSLLRGFFIFYSATGDLRRFVHVMGLQAKSSSVVGESLGMFQADAFCWHRLLTFEYM